MSEPISKKKEFLLADLNSVRALLGVLRSQDIIERLSMERRRGEIESDLRELEESEKHTVGRRASASVYLEGPPVYTNGSNWIEASFAAGIIANYEKAILTVKKEQQLRASRKGERSQTTGKLFLVNVLQGSFGFEFKEVTEPQDDIFDSPLQESVELVSKTLWLSADDKISIDSIVEDIGIRPVISVRELLKTIKSKNASLRIDSYGTEVRLNRDQVSSAYDRVSKVNEDKTETQTLTGWLWVLPLGRRFEFKTVDGKLRFNGKISTEIDIKELEDAPKSIYQANFEFSTVSYPGMVRTHRTLFDFKVLIESLTK